MKYFCYISQHLRILLCHIEMKITNMHHLYMLAKLNLYGKRAAENTAVALTVFEELGFDPKKFLLELKNALKNTTRLLLNPFMFVKLPHEEYIAPNKTRAVNPK